MNNWAKDQPESLDPSRTVFFSPIRKRLPFECGGKWKNASNQRVLFGSRREISSSTLATHPGPIRDKDSQSAKTNGELSERHLWESIALRALRQDNI